jgi:hypothetical protein
MSGPPKKDFDVRIPARFLKDPAISCDAKVLRAEIGAFADGKTGVTFVQPKRLEEILGWGRGRRERAQSELAKAGWLRLKWRRSNHGRWARRIYELCQPTTVARFERSGETAQLISHHSQSQVKSSIPTDLTETSRTVNPLSGDLT